MKDHRRQEPTELGVRDSLGNPLTPPLLKGVRFLEDKNTDSDIVGEIKSGFKSDSRHQIY